MYDLGKCGANHPDYAPRQQVIGNSEFQEADWWLRASNPRVLMILLICLLQYPRALKQQGKRKWGIAG